MVKEIKSKSVPVANVPEVKMAAAEKVLRDIARRIGEGIRKRRSEVLKNALGNGYGVFDLQTNTWLTSGMTSDGCDLSLPELAQRYEDDEKNSRWQRVVIKGVLAGRIAE